MFTMTHEQRLTQLRQLRRTRDVQIRQVNANISGAAKAAVNAGLSKVEVAKLLGISRPTLYKILANAS